MKYKIAIPFSMEDLERLKDGETFDWTFPTEPTGTRLDKYQEEIEIDIHLFNEES